MSLSLSDLSLFLEERTASTIFRAMPDHVRVSAAAKFKPVVKGKGLAPYVACAGSKTDRVLGKSHYRNLVMEISRGYALEIIQAARHAIQPDIPVDSAHMREETMMVVDEAARMFNSHAEKAGIIYPVTDKPVARILVNRACRKLENTGRLPEARTRDVAGRISPAKDKTRAA